MPGVASVLHCDFSLGNILNNPIHVGTAAEYDIGLIQIDLPEYDIPACLVTLHYSGIIRLCPARQLLHIYDSNAS